MLGLLLCLVPQEAWALFLVIGGILIMIGFRKIGLFIVGAIVLLALFTPFLDSLIDSLPYEISILLMVVFFFWIFRVIFGKYVYANIVSALILGLLKAPFKFIGWFFRMPMRRL
jgi:hypothetical protein